MAFGTGAASYIDKVRFTRPRSLNKYLKFTQRKDVEQPEPDSDLEIARTVLMCGLRTVTGVDLHRLQPYLPIKHFQAFVNNL